MTIASFGFLRKVKNRLSVVGRPRRRRCAPRARGPARLQVQRSLAARGRIETPFLLDRQSDRSNGGTSNERMEFLGDSVLSLVVNEYLYTRYTAKSEGELTKMKSVIVSKSILSHFAKKHGSGPLF